MATKKTTKVRKARITTLSQLTALQAEHAELRTGIRQYVRALRHQLPDMFKITLPAKTGDKDTMIRISSLMSSVITAKGLGKEVRIGIQQAEDGGTMFIEFYAPVELPEAVAQATRY